MPPPDQAELARHLRTALGADRVAYWRSDEGDVALPWASDPPDWLRLAFAPDRDAPEQTFAVGRDGIALLPLVLRARVPPAAGVLSLRAGMKGGVFAVWDEAADAPPHLFEVAEFARATLAHQLASPGPDTLAEAERRFSSVAEALPQGILVIPAEDRRQGYVNFTAARLLGIPPGITDTAHLARALAAFAERARNADEVRSYIGPLFRDAGAAPSPCVWRFDGEPSALRVTQAPIGPLGGAGWVWLIDDISPAERAHQLQHLHLAALEAADNAMMIAAADGRIEWANPAFCAMSGYRMDEVIGRRPGEIISSGQTPPALIDEMWRTISSGQVWSGEIVNRRKDGRLYPEHQVITPVRVDGEIRYYVSVKNDVTLEKAAERQLRDALATAQQYQSMADSADTPLALFDLDLRYVVDNRAHSALFKLTHGAVAGKSLEDVLGPERFALTAPRIRACLSTGTAQHFQDAGPFTEDRAYVFNVHLFPHFDAGKLAGAVVVLDDITTLAHARDALQNHQNHLETLVAERTAKVEAAEARLRLILDSSADGLIGTDARGIITFVNPAALHILGYRLEDLVGRNAHATIHVPPRGSGASSHACPLFESIRKGIPVRTDEETFWRADGSPVPVAIATHPMVDGEQTVGGVISFTDISARLRADRALRESEARFRHVADAAPALIWMSGLDKQCDYFNRGWLEFTGRSLEQEAGNGWAEGVHPEDGARCIQVYETAFDARQAFSMEYRLRHHSGEYRWLLDKGVPRFDEQGVFLGYIGACIDIDNLKQAEAARERAHREAERLAQAKSDFLANMSHEIRTPLNGVLGLAQIGHRQSEGNDKLRQTFRSILDSGKLLLAIINDILDLSKIDAGRMEVESVPCSPARIVAEALALVGKRGAEKGLSLDSRLAPDLPAYVLGDPVRIAQVLLNLLSNAIKFTTQGGVTLEVSHDDGQLVLAVGDTGIGMSAEVMERIFQPFQQADTSTTRQFGGTGLGLSISQRLVQLMGGRIQVHSQPGQGSRFEIRLPCPATTAPEAPPEADLAAPDSALSSLPARQRLTGVRVLAAEDNPVNQQVLEGMLEGEGALFRIVDNGALALDAVRQDPNGFDVILMDVQMPVMDGRVATRRIRQLAPGLPVIGQSAHAMTEERRLCLEAGMADTLTKPLNLETLVAAVLRQLPPDRRPAPQPGPRASASSPAPVQAAPALATEDSVIDWPAFTQRFARSPEMTRRLCQRTLDSYAGTAEAIRAAAARQDLEQVQSIAHSIKGMAGYFEAGILQRAAQDAEYAARDRSAHAPERAETLARILDRFVEEVAQGVQ